MSIQRSASAWQQRAAESPTAFRPAVSHRRLCWKIFRGNFARKPRFFGMSSGKFSAVMRNRENQSQDIEKAH
jgi:hypothetical protein